MSDLLLDTHVLIWTVEGSPRLSSAARDALLDPANRLCASTVTAWELEDLRVRGRLPPVAEFGAVVDLLSLVVLDLPATLWSIARTLPDLHRDPVDRMLIAHAIHADVVLVTADMTMRRYPVRTLW